MNIKFLIPLLILFLLSCQILFGQTKIKGKTIDGIYRKPVPFCHISSNEDSLITFSDANGQFSIESEKQLKSIFFKAPNFSELEYKITGDSIVVNIILPRKTFFLPILKSDINAVSLISSFHQKKSQFDYRTHESLEYKINSKSHISSSDIKSFKNRLNRVLRILNKRLNFYPKEHYLISAQKSENYKYYDFFNRSFSPYWKENLGIDSLSESLIEINEDDLNIYNSFFKINSKFYPNPLIGNAQKRYNYKIIDTISSENGSEYIISFYPKIFQKADKLRGFIYLNSKSSALTKLILETPGLVNSNFKVCMEMQNWGSYYLTKEIHYSIQLSNVNSFSTELYLNSNIEISNINSLKSKETKLDEFIYENKRIKNAAINFNKAEDDSLHSNTKEFYNLNKDVKSLINTLSIGQNINQGFIPIGKVNLETDEFFGYNELEKFRLGIGVKTNNKFSNNIEIKSNIAYGLDDERIKNGHEFTLFTNDNKIDWIKIGYVNDIIESGGTKFEQYNNDMFKSEKLRKYRLIVLDRIQKVSLTGNFKIFKYVQLGGGYVISQYDPSYQYTFQGIDYGKYNYSDIIGMLRVGIGEEYKIKGNTIKIIRQPYPVLYLQYTQGTKSFNGDFEYSKLDIRLEYQKRILGYGKSSIQMNLGVTDKSIPYNISYVPKGGRRNASVVFHNTFETMRYNEFLSSEYLSIFYAHNFGSIYIPFLKHFPNLEMLHNIGIGQLKSPENHDLIDFKIMNRPYLESGLFINRIIQLNSFGLKPGIGAGFFYRYGSYQNKLFKDNIVAKLSLSLDL